MWTLRILPSGCRVDVVRFALCELFRDICADRVLKTVTNLLSLFLATEMTLGLSLWVAVAWLLSVNCIASFPWAVWWGQIGCCSEDSSGVLPTIYEMTDIEVPGWFLLAS